MKKQLMISVFAVVCAIAWAGSAQAQTSYWSNASCGGNSYYFWGVAFGADCWNSTGTGNAGTSAAPATGLRYHGQR